MRSLAIKGFLSFVAAVTPNWAYASKDSVGPNGINSAVTGQTGANIHIGQVEVGRPGKPNFDNAANSDGAIDPSQVMLLDDTTPMPNTAIDEHAQQVAGLMISTDPTFIGVAPGAILHASAYDEPINPAQPEASFAAQHVALQGGLNVRAINMSFGEPLVGNDVLDGNSLFTKFVDWSARRDNVLYVIAGNEDSGGIPVPTDNYNNLTVAFSSPVGCVKRTDFCWCVSRTLLKRVLQSPRRG